MLLTILKKLITLGPIGYWPASGTLASIATIPFIFLCSFMPLYFYAFTVLVLCMLGLYAIEKTLSTFATADPSEIVIDELVGMLITFFAVPFTLKSVILGFCLFRLFDILKICGVGWCERFAGSWGIMLDDVWAGIFSNLIMQILLAMELF